MEERNELKFELSYFEYLMLSKKVSSVLKPDPNLRMGIFQYKVSSLYFEDIYDSNPENGDMNEVTHRKFRIRNYNDEEKYHFEYKIKTGDKTLKYSISINGEQKRALLYYNLDVLNNYKHEFIFDEFIKAYKLRYNRPYLYVDYLREAYVSDFNNVRITFDKMMKSAKYTGAYNSAEMQDVLQNGKVILEVKFTGGIPMYIKNILMLNTKDKVSFSKYYLAYKKLAI